MSLNPSQIKEIRKTFPALSVSVHGHPLVYLDSAATSLKPQCVIDAITKYYTSMSSNVHRSVHHLSEVTTKAYEDTREKARRFLNASQANEIIFTYGTTESINCVAYSYGRHFLNQGDEIIISEMEHHSNIVPWQILCKEKGCVLKIIPMDDTGTLIFEEFEKLLNKKTKLVSLVHVSNSLGTINPIKEYISAAHDVGARVLIDGAQAVSHLSVDVQDLDCDFYAFSGHKIFGPTGIGVLYGKKEFLDTMPPFLVGGDMIASVTFEETKYNTVPSKFEAGTPHIAGVIGLSAAIDYIESLDRNLIYAHEQELLAYSTEKLSDLSNVRIIGTAKEKGPMISFILPGIHAHDLGTLADSEGIAIRTGHLCTQPVMKYFDIPTVSRASFSLYNTKQEIDLLVNVLAKAKKIFE